MKPRKPVVLGHQPEPAAREVLERKAAELQCQVYNADATVRLHNKGLRTDGDQLRQIVSVERLGVPSEGPLSGEASSQQSGEIIVNGDIQTDTCMSVLSMIMPHITEMLF